MLAHDNKALVRQFFDEVWTQGNLVAAEVLLAPDFVDHHPLLGASHTGDKAGFIGARAALHAVFPDLAFTLEAVFAEGDRVVTRWCMHGTHRGMYLGLPGTGRQFTITGITIYRIANDQIAEAWVEPNTVSLLQQLGLIPPPGQANRGRYYVWRSLR